MLINKFIILFPLIEMSEITHIHQRKIKRNALYYYVEFNFVPIRSIILLKDY